LFETLKEFVDDEDDEDDEDDDDEEVDEGDMIPLLPFTVDKRLCASLNERFVEELVCNLLEDDDEDDDDDVHEEDGDGDGDIMTELVFTIEFSCFLFDDALLAFDWLTRFSSFPL
jgi:hypothetical protein